jgi:4-hydroxy-tetrahydrodipicolinate reductase
MAVVQGASGRMGREVIGALAREPGLQLAGAVEINIPDSHLAVPDGSGTVPFSSNLKHILTSCKADVLIDFTTAPTTMSAVATATRLGVNLVIGTTGLTASDLEQIDRLAKANRVGAVVAPNFALGAVLMVHLAKIAAKYFDYAEIIEQHHHLKTDAPSGTALATARAMADARDKPFQQPPGQRQDSRRHQTEGVTIHSVRLPGILARQEVILGGPGQTLTVKHDTVSRECYMPGVMLAAKEVVGRQGLIYGLDALLGL